MLVIAVLGDGKTVEHEKDYELDKWTLIVEQLKALSIVDRLNIDALRSSCRIAGTLIGGTLSNIASRLSLAGRLNSWVEIEETDGQVAHENTGHLVNQSIGEKLDQEHGQETDSMAVYTLDEERMCLTFEDKRKTDWEGSTQEFGALQLMNKTVQALFQQVNKLLQQVPDAGTVQKLAEAFSQRLWQEMSMIRSWTAWTISLIAAWLMSHLSRCKHRQSRTERKVFARTKQVRRRQLRASLFASWLRCGRAMDQEMFLKMAAMTEAATKAATAAETALASLAGGSGGAKFEFEQQHAGWTCKQLGRSCAIPSPTMVRIRHSFMTWKFVFTSWLNFVEPKFKKHCWRRLNSLIRCRACQITAQMNKH